MVRNTGGAVGSYLLPKECGIAGGVVDRCWWWFDDLTVVILITDVSQSHKALALINDLH